MRVSLDAVVLFTDMREASKRLAESLFDSYENDWAGEEDLGAIVEVRPRGRRPSVDLAEA